MKRLLLLCLLCVSICSCKKGHIEVLGINVGVGYEQFSKELINKGFEYKEYNEDNKCYEGDFIGKDATLFILSEDNIKIKGVQFILLQLSSWKEVIKEYERVVNIYKEKYNVKEEIFKYIVPYDEKSIKGEEVQAYGEHKLIIHTIFQIPNGEVLITPMVSKDINSNKYLFPQLSIIYLDNDKFNITYDEPYKDEI